MVPQVCLARATWSAWSGYLGGRTSHRKPVMCAFGVRAGTVPGRSRRHSLVDQGNGGPPEGHRLVRLRYAVVRCWYAVRSALASCDSAGRKADAGNLKMRSDRDSNAGPTVRSTLRAADVGERRGGLLYFAAVSLAQAQVGADRLCLEVKRAPELVARARRVATQRRPGALAALILAATARLDVVLPHDTDYVGDLDGHVTAVITNVGYPGNSSVARPLDLRPGKPMVVGQETQAIGRYLNERRSFPHEGSLPRLGCLLPAALTGFSPRDFPASATARRGRRGRRPRP